MVTTALLRILQDLERILVACGPCSRGHCAACVGVIPPDHDPCRCRQCGGWGA